MIIPLSRCLWTEWLSAWSDWIFIAFIAIEPVTNIAAMIIHCQGIVDPCTTPEEASVVVIVTSMRTHYTRRTCSSGGLGGDPICHLLDDETNRTDLASDAINCREKGVGSGVHAEFLSNVSKTYLTRYSQYSVDCCLKSSLVHLLSLINGLAICLSVVASQELTK